MPGKPETRTNCGNAVPFTKEVPGKGKRLKTIHGYRCPVSEQEQPYKTRVLCSPEEIATCMQLISQAGLGSIRQAPGTMKGPEEPGHTGADQGTTYENSRDSN